MTRGQSSTPPPTPISRDRQTQESLSGIAATFILRREQASSPPNPIVGFERSGAQGCVVWAAGSLSCKVNKIIALLDPPPSSPTSLQGLLGSEISAQPGASLAYLEGCGIVLLGVGGTPGTQAEAYTGLSLGPDLPLCPWGIGLNKRTMCQPQGPRLAYLGLTSSALTQES